MNGLAQVSTCLFTGAALDATTREEHTIPRSLGGRVVSRLVSSTEFNERCGGQIDPYLVLPYEDIINALNPMLAIAHRGGNIPVEIPGEQGEHIRDELGRVHLSGVRIDARDPATNRPTAASAVDADAARRVLEQAQPGRQITQRIVPSTGARISYTTRVAISPQAELAALKSALLTFDHVLIDHPNRFTRSPALQPVREFVRSVVMDGEDRLEGLNRHSLGLQYDRLGLIRAFRASLPVAPSDFEHVLIASGNPGTRTVDLLWFVLGVDPFGFRVCHDWRGDAFTCVFVNQVLRNGQAFGPHWIPRSETLCAPTDFRSVPDNSSNLRHGEWVATMMSPARREAASRARWLVENQADDYLADMLVNTATLENDHSIGAAVRVRAERLYHLRLQEDGRRQFFDELFRQLTVGVPIELVQVQVVRETDRTMVNWPAVLALYRQFLAGLEVEFGRPVESFQRAVVGGHDDGSRPLGDLPPRI